MKDTIRKVLGNLLILTLFFLPVGTFKPNRILNGNDFFSVNIFTFEFFLFALFFISYFINRKNRFLSIIRSLFLVILPVYLIYRVQAFQFIGDYDETIARISLHISAFLTIMGVIILLSTEKYPKIKIFMSLFLVLTAFIFNLFPMLGLSREFINRRETFNAEFFRHLTLAISSLLFAIIPSIFFAYQSTKHEKLREWIMGFINGFQVAPTLSLIALIMIPLSYLGSQFPFLRDLGIKGIGFLPSFIILTLYALLPITSNTYTALKQIEPSIMDSAYALGLNRTQIMFKIQFPLALPLIISGIRIALVQSIGNTILAGLVGGGGLGSIIFLGLSQSAADLILLGSIPVVFMALTSDIIFEVIEEKIKVRMGLSR